MPRNPARTGMPLPVECDGVAGDPQEAGRRLLTFCNLGLYWF
jgi:hypothetical protein